MSPLLFGLKHNLYITLKASLTKQDIFAIFNFAQIISRKKIALNKRQEKSKLNYLEKFLIKLVIKICFIFSGE